MKNIVIGKKSEIDKRAIIGQKTGRKIKSRKLSIGRKAKIRSNSVIAGLVHPVVGHSTL